MKGVIVNAAFALEHIKKWVPSFAELRVESASLERMTGITNQTFRFSHIQEDIEPKDVIFRVFGKTCEGTFINRNDETIVYQAVSEVGLGPKMLGYDNNTRAEEFLHSRVLKQNEMTMPLYRRQVALNLSEFHQIKISNITKEPLLRHVYTDETVLAAVENKINQTALFTENELTLIEEMKRVWFSRSEKDLILSFFPADDDADQIQFCHNDLLANNVLILDSDKSVRFIDFEYSHYNIRAFDIANYFNESQYDYTVSEEPFFALSTQPVTAQETTDFVRHYVLGYLLTKNKIPYYPQQLSSANDETYFNELLSQIDISIFNTQVNHIINQELTLGTCLSHFYWGIWALHMSKDPTICFDYVKFAYSRFQKYQESKKILLQSKIQAANPVSSQ